MFLTVPSQKPAEVRELLDSMVLDPRHKWLPLSPYPHPVVVPAPSGWSRAFPSVKDFDFPSLASIEDLVDFYMRAGLWDCAFVLALGALRGTYDVPPMTELVWDGSPGVSRLWAIRGTTMVPVPKGQIKKALETWWALSGGYLNRGRKFLYATERTLRAHMNSVGSPIHLFVPFGLESGDDVLDRVLDSIQSDAAYPARLKMIRARGQYRHGAIWQDDLPIDWAPDLGVPMTRAQVRTAPLGLNWLDKARDTIPPQVFRIAEGLRERAFEP